MITPGRAPLNEYQRLVLDVADSVVTRRITTAAAGIDREDEIPAEVLAAITQAELPGLVLASHDMSETVEALALLSALVVRRLATASPAVAMVVAAGHAAGAAALATVDPAAVAHQLKGCQRIALVDGQHHVTATSDGESGWRLDGLVEYAPAALGADAVIVLTGSQHDEPHAFVVEPSSHSLDIGRPRPRSGLHGSSAARMHFDSLRLAGDARIGGINSVLAGRHHTALTVAAAAVGVAESALDQTRGYLAQRHQFGHPLSDFVALRAMVGEMATQRDAAWALVDTATRQLTAQDDQASSACARAASVATRAAVGIGLDALQLHGGYGYTQEFPIERMLRDALSLRARAGGMRAHLMHSAEALLGRTPEQRDVPGTGSALAKGSQL